jgi:cyanophycinase
LAVVAVLSLLVNLAPIAAQTTGPSAGYLVIHGGGDSLEPLREFIRLAGGTKARIVVIPTAAGLERYDEAFQKNYFRPFREEGVVDIALLHATSRQIADSDAFVAPLAKATGVWLTGGRQWRLADTYLGTKTESALWEVLKRGGVVGGGSAGATIQGSYLVRGDTRGALAPVGDHEQGFGFLKNVAIDQHVLARNRQFDLLAVVRAHPTLLGIGIDADAGIVVNGDEFTVIGNGYVAIYDPMIVLANNHFYFLRTGERFRLSTRTPMTANGEPLWMPQILPRASLKTAQLRQLSGTYRSRQQSIRVSAAGGFVTTVLCGEQHRFIPIATDLFYDEFDGSQLRFQRTTAGVVSGLTWKPQREVGKRICVEGTIEAAKQPR